MFKNRMEAGKLLADKLAKLHLNNSCLLAVPRGGVPIALPIAQKLNSQIHLLITRKIGHPANSEIAIGAVMPDGSAIYSERNVSSIGLSSAVLKAMIATEHQEIRRRQILYTATIQAPQVNSKTAIVIDDGIATGYTIRAAMKWLKQEQAAKVIIAVPVAPPDVIRELSREVDEVICLVQPDQFYAVGMHYEDFSQISDQEVIEILDSMNTTIKD
ncbi:phosphoribosyltransferase [bacterium BFN5]|nr:phosphoribosyltransferase [bacterium BFN5]